MFPESSRAVNELGWTISRLEECSSTNDVAKDLPVWHAVLAGRQLAGRGRFGRTWQSGEGGVWMSAVVPAPVSEPLWKMMPLAAGHAVATTIMELGVASVKLRWPNDVMVGARKCAGILVDRFHVDRCVVGMGVNVFNDPALQDPALKDCSVRLADVLEKCPDLDQVAERILANLRFILMRMEKGGALELIHRLDLLWKIPTLVEMHINEKILKRMFCGVNNQGWVRLKSSEGSIEEFAPEDIRMMREI
ncbi:MAG: Bifunctional ligase/repressor BirA [Elusimicrobia bacterium]|nr:Bifunctional ligase/repressor BirA [Elusimicrobiota bacterium]